MVGCLAMKHSEELLMFIIMLLLLGAFGMVAARCKQERAGVTHVGTKQQRRM